MTNLYTTAVFDLADASQGAGNTGEFAATPAIVLPVPASFPEVEAGPLPPPPRKYLRPSANWADRWLTVKRP
jgi:hypothetical protein